MAKTEEKNQNLRFYEALRQVPQHALKAISAGRLKGMSDINPLWRIKAMTEAFGPCGIGWRYDITRQWTETYGTETKAFCNINLYVKVDGEWSEAIPGTGGSSFVTQERSGAYVSDECLDGNCELLTKNGWVKLKDYDGESEVAQYYPYSEMIDFYKPLRFIHKQSSDIYDKEGFLMTGKHRHIILSRGTNDYQVRYVEDLAKLAFRESDSGYGRSGNFRDLKCGHFTEKRNLTLLDKIGIMLACDGTIYRQNGDGKLYWRCEFSKDRKIKKAESLLQSYGVSYKKSTNKREIGDTVSFVFELGNCVNYKTYKNFLPYADYQGLWDEIVSWDGCVKDHESFYTANKESAEYLQTLLCLSGEVVSVYKENRKSENHSDIYTLYRKKHSTAMSGFKKVDGTIDVYCVEVPTTFILVRKNGEILVTGNCHKMALTDALSVAMKALGVAADVYFSKDTHQFETKYEQQAYAASQSTATIPQPTTTAPVPPPPPPPTFGTDLEEAFQLIRPNIDSAPSRAYLQDLHKQNTALHDYPPYRVAMNARFSEVE